MKTGGFALPKREYATATGPIRPISIVTESVIFPTSLNEDVMPVDKPTVPNADVISNKSD